MIILEKDGDLIVFVYHASTAVCKSTSMYVHDRGVFLLCAVYPP